MFLVAAASGSARSGGCYASCVTQQQRTLARQVIIQVFRSRGWEAVRVAQCESGLSVRAYNGDYLGLFQVSGHWRRTVPGFAMNPWAQAQHAYRVFRLTGSNWSHWSCRP